MSFSTIISDMGIYNKAKQKPCMTAFIVSLIMLFLYSLIQGIYPFGSVTFLRKDLYHQYLPFLYELRRKLISGESLKYSFNLGIGSSFYAMYVYYLSDPLNFLCILVPERFLLEFLTLITYMKIALASANMCRYLRYRNKGMEAVYLIPLSLCYGFSGYIASFDWNVMWMWGIALAPVTLMGFEKVFDGEKSYHYILPMAFTVWTNYYIAMVIGIFLVFYFVVLCVERYDGLLKLLKSGISLLISTIISAGMCAVLLIPEWASIRQTSFAGIKFPHEIKFYLSLPKLMVRSLMAVGVETGLGHEPAIYASVAVLMLAPLYFMNKDVPLRCKITKGFLIVFFYLSFDTNVLEYIWHGFNYPDSIPARQAFLFVIILLSLAEDGIYSLHRGDKKILITGLIPVAIYSVCLVFCRSESHTDRYTWIFSAIFILIYMTLTIVYAFMPDEFASWGRMAAVFILIFELSINLSLTSSRDISREAYFRHIGSYWKLAEEAAAINPVNQGHFTRLDVAEQNIRNISCLAGYADASYFSSTINEGVTDFYKEFGMKASRVHYMADGMTPFTAMIMGVDYILADDFRNNQTDYDVAFYKGEEDGDYLYERLFMLPFGYAVPYKDYDFDMETENMCDPVVRQNRISVKLGGDEVFHEISDEYIHEEEGRAEIYVPEDGHYYAWTDADVDEVSEYTELHEAEDEPYGRFEDMKYNSVMDLGRLDKGDTVTLLSDEESEEDYLDIALYRIDPVSMQSLEDRLGEETLTLTEFEDDHIEGIIDISEKKELLLTMPCSDGWEIIMDGNQRIEPESFYGLFMMLPLPEGLHHISLSYHIPFFTTGVITTLISLFIFIALIICGHHRKAITK